MDLHPSRFQYLICPAKFAVLCFITEIPLSSPLLQEPRKSLMLKQQSCLYVFMTFYDLDFDYSFIELAYFRGKKSFNQSKGNKDQNFLSDGLISQLSEMVSSNT